MNILVILMYLAMYVVTIALITWAVYKTVQYHVEKRRESDVKEQQEKEADTSSV